MQQTFDTILSSILSAIDENAGNGNVDEIIEQKISEIGLSAQGKELLTETNSLLEAFEEKKRSLMEAKEKGETHETWMQTQLYELSKKNNLDENTRSALISDAEVETQKCLTELIEKGE